MKKIFAHTAVTALMCFGLTPAQAIGVQLNGQPLPGKVLVQGGTTYVSIDTLKALGYSVSLQGDS